MLLAGGLAQQGGEEWEVCLIILLALDNNPAPHLARSRCANSRAAKDKSQANAC
jgi:hypothetical protein